MTSSLEEICDIKTWIDTGEMNLPKIEVQRTWLIENVLISVDKLLAQDKPEDTRASVTLLNAFLSAAASKNPSLVKKLSVQMQNLTVATE